MEDSKPRGSSAVPCDIGAVTVKLPTFWSSHPKVWFAQAEAQFVLRGITLDDTKYYHLLAALDQDTAKRVTDCICEPPEENKYGILKARLLATFMPSPYRMAQTLLNLAPLGDRTPSLMMDDMLALLGSHEPCILFRTIFVDALPQEVRPHLIPSLETLPPRDLALLADRIIRNDATIAAIAKKTPGSKGASAIPRDWCRLHRKWGAKAFRCIEPCSFAQSSNMKICNVQGNEEGDLQ